MGSLDLHNTFSCTDPAVTQEVPMLHGKVHLLPICGCPVQTKISTSSLSKVMALVVAHLRQLRSPSSHT